MITPVRKPGPRKLYSLDELLRLRDEIERRYQPYPDPHRPDCYRVPVVSRLHPNMEAIIDAEDLPLIQGKRWNWSPGSHGYGSVVFCAPRNERPPLHQIIMGVQGRKYRVGHLNGDPLDCRRGNLIVRTPAEQKAATRKLRSKNGRACSSRFKGVSLDDGGKWIAMIAVRGTSRYLGRFLSEIDAALAYDAALYELHGRHALLNFPDPAHAERLRRLEPAAKPATVPPPGMVDSDGAAQLLCIPPATWSAWERVGRLPTRGQPAMTLSGKPCILYAVEELSRLQQQFAALAKPYPDPDRPGCYRVPLKSFLDYREAIIDADALSLVEGRNWNWGQRREGIGGGQVIEASINSVYAPLARLVAGVNGNSDARVSHRNVIRWTVAGRTSSCAPSRRSVSAAGRWAPSTVVSTHRGSKVCHGTRNRRSGTLNFRSTGEAGTLVTSRTKSPLPRLTMKPRGSFSVNTLD
jgi:hypothetical protein